MYKMYFEAGEGRFLGTHYFGTTPTAIHAHINLLTSVRHTEDGDVYNELYAECELPEALDYDEYDTYDDYNRDYADCVPEDYGYLTLKKAILKLAAEHGISTDQIWFWYDGQEEHLSPEANLGEASAKYLGD